MLTDALTYVDLQDAGNAQSQLILMVLARLADWETGVYIGPQKRVAQAAKCDVRTLRRHLRRLARDGFIATARRTRSDRSNSTNEIVLLGYAEWYAALRTGGRIAAPKAASRYADPSKIAPDNLSGGVPANDPAPSKIAPDNLSGGTGHLLSGGTGQQVSAHISLSNQSKNSLPPPPQTSPVDAGDGGGGKFEDDLGTSCLPPVRVAGKARRERPGGTGPEPSGLQTRGWDEGWDQAARHAVYDLAETGAPVATALLIPLVGTLKPPRGAHGASYVRDVAEQLAEVPAVVLARLAVVVRAEAHTRLPAASVLLKLAMAVAKSMAAGNAQAARAARAAAGAGSAAAWLAALRAGDPHDLATAVCRRLVARLGLAAAHAWFGEAEFARDGDRLLVTQPNEFTARYAGQHMAEDVLAATRAEWPDVVKVAFASRPQKPANAA